MVIILKLAVITGMALWRTETMERAPLAAALWLLRWVWLLVIEVRLPSEGRGKALTKRPSRHLT